MSSHAVSTQIDSPNIAVKGLADYLAVLQRRKFVLLLAFFGVLTLSGILALVLPAIYQSTATILMERQDIPDNLIQTTGNTFANQTLGTIRQRVMTRDNLIRILEKHKSPMLSLKTGPNPGISRPNWSSWKMTSTSRP